MSYTTTIEKNFNISENGVIQINVNTSVYSADGKPVGYEYNNHKVCPGDDVSEEHAIVQTVATALWTPEVVAAYEAQVAAEIAGNEPPYEEPEEGEGSEESGDD